MVTINHFDTLGHCSWKVVDECSTAPSLHEKDYNATFQTNFLIYIYWAVFKETPMFQISIIAA